MSPTAQEQNSHPHVREAEQTTYSNCRPLADVDKPVYIIDTLTFQIPLDPKIPVLDFIKHAIAAGL